MPKSFSRLAHTPELSFIFSVLAASAYRNKQHTAAKKITAEDTAPL